MDTKTDNYIEICPGCLACYNQGRLTFYWFRITKDTTLKQIEQALDIEEIHRKAKTPYACGGDEVHIQDNDFCGGEYMSAKELFGYVQLLKLIPNFDYVRAFKNIYLMEDEFYYPEGNHEVEVSSMFKEYAESVQVFDSQNDVDIYLDDTFTEINNIDYSKNVHNYIDWEKVRRDLMYDYKKTEVNSKIYLWREI
jgi:antirestriction protein|tara:strand:+ start:1020 stop:1604 length:585 start_codon:yes stop_codon:yes gene_type:complete